MNTWREVARGWADEPAARRAQTESILDCGYQGVLWETSVSATGSEPFEQALVRAAALAKLHPTPDAFAGKLRAPVNTFRNLRGDSGLIAPSDTGPWAHLVPFLRDAPRDQVQAMWRMLGEEILKWWKQDNGPLWVSTHGFGVSWLHVRLDPRPKYYKSELRFG